MKRIVVSAVTVLMLGATAARAALPEVSEVTLGRQAHSRKVEVSYRANASGIATFFFTTNGVSIGANGRITAIKGAINRVVDAGQHRFSWDAAHDFPERLFDNLVAEVQLWPTNDPPDYCAVQLEEEEGIYPIRWFASSNEVPFGVGDARWKSAWLLLRKVPVGKGEFFTMGNAREGERLTRISRPFFLGVYPVTQAQWWRVMGNWPAVFSLPEERDTRPVERVSYEMVRGSVAQECNWPLDGDQVAPDSFMGVLRARCAGRLLFDLPTEAQWVHACRAGRYEALNRDNEPALLARYKENGGYVKVGNAYEDPKNAVTGGRAATTAAAGGTAHVGSYLPNAWGLYDMHGNVLEWCLDWHSEDFRQLNMLGEDPLGALSGEMRVQHGGSWRESIENCRTLTRFSAAPDVTGIAAGLRVAVDSGLAQFNLLDDRYHPEVFGLEPPALNGGSGSPISAQTFFAEGGFECYKSADGVVKVVSQERELVMRGDDGGVISSLSGSSIHYEYGRGGLFRDLFWVPATGRWGEDAYGAYTLGTPALDDNGHLVITLKRILTNPDLAGLHLTKQLVVAPDLNHIKAQIKIENKGGYTREVRYWSWNRLDLAPGQATIRIQGEEAQPLGAATARHTFIQPQHSEWVKVGDHCYLGWDSTRYDKTPVFLDRVHLWNPPESPAVGFIGKSVQILPGSKALQVRIRYNRITSQLTEPPVLSSFQLAHPYAVKKALAYRASIHNHTQFEPTYTHAPVPPAQRLLAYREFDCEPRYKIVSITDHNRLTIPSNTDPVGLEDPAWGVEGMLFIPGGELTIGYSSHSLGLGSFFGEINCVGLPTASDDPTDQESFYHKQSLKTAPESYLKHLISAGVYVGLCHPNARLDEEGVHRWTASGYSYDELDLIFGNPEKGLEPMEEPPQGLEIGNQGYDFTDRSGFINAEGKWDMLLTRGHRLVGTASDDSHGASAMGGWIVAFIDELTYGEFMASLLSGNFYASQGPQITDITVSGNTLSVTTDQAALIEFIGRGGTILQGHANALTAQYTVQGHEVYVRARVTRECPEMKRVGGGIGYRRSAWTNPIYLEPLE